MAELIIKVRQRSTVVPEKAILPLRDRSSGVWIKNTEASRRWAPLDPFLSSIPTFIHRDVYDSIHAHALKGVPDEIGGALLGHWSVDGNRYFLTIAYVLHLHQGPWCGRTRLIFPHEFVWALDRFVQELKVQDPTVLRLGLYHSHPGYGVFLSSTDLRMLAGFFNEPWHTAMVVDPYSGDEGLFFRRDNRIAPRGALYVLRPREIETPPRRRVAFSNEFLEAGGRA